MSSVSIGTMPDPMDAELASRLRTLSPATLGHLTSEGFPRGLTPLRRPVRMAGIAVTLRLPSIDSCLMHYVADRLQPGHVLVVDRDGESDHACLGGMVGYRLKLAGIAGAVVDGPVTDVEELLEYGFPVYHRGVSATTTRIVDPAGELNSPVVVGGAVVEPGDFVIGDSDGLFVAKADMILPRIDDLLARQEWEAPAKLKMDEGTPIAQLSGAEEKITTALGVNA